MNSQRVLINNLISYILANVGKRESERMLPFNMWMNFPTGNSPYFEVLFVIQVLTIIVSRALYIASVSRYHL